MISYDGLVGRNESFLQLVVVIFLINVPFVIYEARQNLYPIHHILMIHVYCLCCVWHFNPMIKANLFSRFTLISIDILFTLCPFICVTRCDGDGAICFNPKY